jgi:nucleotide-binding universal stress UspA family protein
LKVISAVESLQSLRPESWGLPQGSYRKLENALEAQARAAVEKAVAQFRQTAGQSVAVLSEVLPGRAREVILDEAEKWGADLIMLGSRGLGGVARLLLGSVSSAVLSHANCSVEIVRQRSS